MALGAICAFLQEINIDMGKNTCFVVFFFFFYLLKDSLVLGSEEEFKKGSIVKYTTGSKFFIIHGW